MWPQADLEGQNVRLALESGRAPMRACTAACSQHRTLALPDEVKHWSLTTLREKLIKIGAKVVRHGQCSVRRFVAPGLRSPQFFDRFQNLSHTRRPSISPASSRLPACTAAKMAASRLVRVLSHNTTRGLIGLRATIARKRTSRGPRFFCAGLSGAFRPCPRYAGSRRNIPCGGSAACSRPRP